MTFTADLLRQLIEDPIPVLNNGYRTKERIAARQERIAEWRQIAESITQNVSGAPGGHGFPTSKTEKCVISIVELEDQIRDEIASLVEDERQTSEIISAFVKDPNHKAVLEYRYLSYLKLEDIAVKMDYTFRWTQELHRRAVQSLKDNAAIEYAAISAVLATDAV